jgi:hypothetical protein
MNFTQEQVNAIVTEARVEANKAAEAFRNQYGDRDCCGFAWTSIYGIKGSTKIGRMLQAAGVRKNSYDRCFQLWNPSGLGVQSMNILEEGAMAAAKVFRKYGFDASSGSRMD